MNKIYWSLDVPEFLKHHSAQEVDSHAEVFYPRTFQLESRCISNWEFLSEGSSAQFSLFKLFKLR